MTLINNFILTCLLFLIQQSSIFSSSKQRKLPDKILAGYAHYKICNESVIQTTVKNGVNVIIWFSIDLSTDDLTGQEQIRNRSHMDCVAKTANKLNQLKLDTIHLISIGGWNEKHPNTRNNAKEYYKVWLEWNENSVASKELNFKGFDGIDWDLEGNDDLKSPYNFFTIEVLDLMGELSQLFKKDGYFVSMAPAESYLDPTTSEFSRYVNFTYPEWEKEAPNFQYHGRNLYAYLIAKYGSTLIEEKNITIPTFDFVSVQLYETYSHTFFNLNRLNMSFKEYLYSLMKKLTQGWEVDFSTDPELKLEKTNIKLNKEQIVIGLANGWAKGYFLFIETKDIEEAYLYTQRNDINLAPRGFMFYDIESEGKIPEGQTQPYWMAPSLNNFLNTRTIKRLRHIPFIGMN